MEENRRKYDVINGDEEDRKRKSAGKCGERDGRWNREKVNGKEERRRDETE